MRHCSLLLFFRFFTLCILIGFWPSSAERNEIIGELETTFNFPKYSYKRSANVEQRFRAKSNKCELTTCSGFDDLERKNCINNCVSKICYEEIYASNPLEEGEIDQRQTSFKGCFATYL